MVLESNKQMDLCTTGNLHHTVDVLYISMYVCVKITVPSPSSFPLCTGSVSLHHVCVLLLLLLFKEFSFQKLFIYGETATTPSKNVMLAIISK